MVKHIMSFHIEPREGKNIWLSVFSVFLSIIAGLIIGSILIYFGKANVFKAYYYLAVGGFGSTNAILDTLTKATPLIFTGLAAAVAFRSQIWNIGAEGQFLAGAMAAYWTIISFGKLPSFLLIPLLLIMAFIVGAGCGLLAAALKNWFNVDVIVSTVMMNYIIAYLLSFLISGVWQAPGSYYQQSSFIPDASFLPILISKSRLHIGLIIAILIAIITYLLMEKTSLGFEIKAIGSNPIAAEFKGINPLKNLSRVMMISGGIAAIGGAIEVTGLIHRLNNDISIGFGFSGIIVAMLAGLNPLGVILASILFGGLINGSYNMQVNTGIPITLATAIQGIILLFSLGASIITKYRIWKTKDGD